VFDGTDLWRAHYATGIYKVNPTTGAAVLFTPTYTPPGGTATPATDIVGITKIGATFWITRWDDVNKSVGTWNPGTNVYTPRFVTTTNPGGLAYDPISQILWVGRLGGSVDPYDMSSGEPTLIAGKGFQPLGPIANTIDGLEFVTEIPAPVVDQQQLEMGAQGWFIGTVPDGVTDQRVAQVVTAGASRFLTAVQIPADCHTNTPMTLEIQGVTEGGAPNGTVLSTRTGAVGPGTFALNTFVQVSLQSPLFVAAGTKFAIVMRANPPTEGSGNCAIRQGPGTEVYAGGNAFAGSGGAWGSIPDLPFKTIVR
jgi:hypothetical protein